MRVFYVIVPLLLALTSSCTTKDSPTNSELVTKKQADQGVVSIENQHKDSLSLLDTTSTGKKSLNYFANMHYFLTSDYDLDKCDALAKCDCCVTEIYFVTDSTFIECSRCIPTSTFFKGKYTFNSKQLTLYYDSIVVSEVVPFMDDEEIEILTERKYIAPSTLSIDSCGNKILLHIQVDNYHEYGTIDSQYKILQSIVDGTNEEISKALEL